MRLRVRWSPSRRTDEQDTRLATRMEDGLLSGRPRRRTAASTRAKAGMCVHGTCGAIGCATLVLCAVAVFPVGIAVALFAAVWAAYAAAVAYPYLYSTCTAGRCDPAPALEQWLRTAIYVLAAVLYAWVVILFAVRVAAPPPSPTAFPSACRGGASAQNCARVVPGEPNIGMAKHPAAAPLALRTTRAALLAAVRAWARDQTLSRVLHDDPAAAFLHIRFLSVSFGFPDDLYASAACNGTSAVLSLQSQARLGKSDFGVNGNRLAALLSHIPHPAPADCV